MVFLERRTELAALVTQRHERAAALVQAAQRADDEARALAAEGVQEREAAQHYFGQLQAALQQRQAQVERDVDALVGRKTRALQAQGNRLQAAAMMVQKQADQLQQHMDCGHASGALSLSDEITTDIARQRAAESGQCALEAVEWAGVKVVWDPTAAASVEQAMARLGPVADTNSLSAADSKMQWEHLGPGVTLCEAKLDEEVAVEITAFNSAGVGLGCGGHGLTARLVRTGGEKAAAAEALSECQGGQETVECWVEDHRDGTYVLRVRPEKLGDYAVVATCRGATLSAGLRLAVRPCALVVVGKGGNGPSQFNAPRHVAVSRDGSVFVADSGNNRVQVFRSDGSFVRMWGIAGSCHSQFSSPHGITVSPDGDMVYVADSTNHRVQVFRSIDGSFVSTWGNGPAQWQHQGQFTSPYGIAASNGDMVYVADTNNQRMQVFRNKGTFVRMWGSGGPGSNGQGQFHKPTGIAVSPDGAFVYVADTNNHRIQVFRSDGTFVRTWGSYGQGQGQFYSPNGIAVSSDGDMLYVSDSSNHRIQVFRSDGTFAYMWGVKGSDPGQFNEPFGIAVSPDGCLLCVTESANQRVQVFALLSHKSG